MIHAAPIFLVMALFLPGGFCGAWSDSTIVKDGQTPSSQQKVQTADSYAVQVGRFDNEDLALELATQLRAKGYSPYVLVAKGQDNTIWHAVRLSLHENLEKAREAARVFNEKEHRHAVVAIAGSAAPVPSAEQRYFLQAGAFRERGNALERVRVYRKKGFRPGIVKLYDNKNRLWHIVYVGVFDGLQPARQAAEKFRDTTGEPCYINAIDPELFQQRVEELK